MNVSEPNSTAFPSTGKLTQAIRIFEGKVRAVETVIPAPDGSFILVDDSGKLFRAKDGAGAEKSCSSLVLDQEPLVDVGHGKVLGGVFVPSASDDAALGPDLYLCDGVYGILKVKGVLSGDSGKIKVYLASGKTSTHNPLDLADKPFYFADDIDHDAAGNIYFTSATDIVPKMEPGGRWDMLTPCYLAFAQGVPKGRLMQYNASHGTVVLAEGFGFANGVALAHDESYVAVADSLRARVVRYWLTGPLAGSVDVLIDKLPGMPDGVSRSSDGNFWLAIYGYAPPIAKYGEYAAVRALVAWLPASMRPPVKKVGMAVKVSPSGQVLQVVDDLSGEVVSGVTAVTESEGRLLLGNLHHNYISCVDM